ncbi:MAG: hypothetical protein ACLQJR_09385 [Stellaceae bacterium]
MNYAEIAKAMGCRGIRVEDPGALATGIGERDRPTVVDVVVTRDPGKMLPALDSRTVEIKQGGRCAMRGSLLWTTGTSCTRPVCLRTRVNHVSGLYTPGAERSGEVGVFRGRGGSS